MIPDTNHEPRLIVSPRARSRSNPPTAFSPSAADLSASKPTIVSRGRFRIMAKPVTDEPLAEAPCENVPSAPALPLPKAQAPAKRTGPNWDEHGNFYIGKGRPPIEGQIKPGEVRNKRGPKKGEVDFVKAMNKALSKKSPIKLGGKRVLMDAIQLAAHNLRALVIDKNLAAIKFVVELQALGEARGSGNVHPTLTEDQQAFIAQVLRESGFEANPVVRKNPGEHSKNG